MLVGGVDIGSTTAKAVILKDDQLILGTVLRVTTKPEQTAELAMAEALRNAGLSSVDQLEFVVSTGYGRLKTHFAQENVSEISCHARGAWFVLPSVRTIVDIGGQDCKSMSVTEKGTVASFEMNDRCAAGTGRFFDVMAKVLTCGYDGISSMENVSETPAHITNQCSVFAESEVISLVNNDVPLRDIISGINLSVAGRAGGLLRRVGLKPDVVMTGGCSKNEGLIHALEKALGVTIRKLPIDPQFMGAVGAAVFARDKATAKKGVPLAAPPAAELGHGTV